MRFEYGPRHDIANIRFVDPKESPQIVQDVVVEREGAHISLGFSAAGLLVEIEILGASTVLLQSALDAADKMDEG